MCITNVDSYTYVTGALGSWANISSRCSTSDGVFWTTLTCDRSLPNDPAKVGRRCVRRVVRSCPSDRFFCSLGLSAKEISLSALRCLPNGKVKVGACRDGSSGTSDAGTGSPEEVAALSACSLSCLNLLKYRSEANSVMWRGSMTFCVWPLCHPVAEMETSVLDTAYQGRGDEALRAGGRQRRADGESYRDVVTLGHACIVVL